jgi:acetate kinase
MRILVFNCGSSSLKFELVELDTGLVSRRTLARGAVEEIGRQARYAFHAGPAGGAPATGNKPLGDHAGAACFALDWLESSLGAPLRRLDGCAHRVVHGGERLVAPALVGDETIAAIEQASVFAPLHNPAALAVVRAAGERLAGVRAVVVTDTAFHQTMPEHAQSYALPRSLAARRGIRRFGFHGIGHAYMLERYAELTGVAPEQLDLVTLQLGAGCSACAVAAGRSVDTSMGLTPLEGLMMARRSGDLDPAIVGYLARSEKLSLAEVERLLDEQSGLLGVSELSADMRELEAEAARDPQGPAALAIRMFCYRVRKYIGAYLAVLGGADAVIFAGGIGEHSALVRAEVCAGLKRLGIILDPGKNAAAGAGEASISTDDSPVKVQVIPLDEELYIARAAARLLAG